MTRLIVRTCVLSILIIAAGAGLHGQVSVRQTYNEQAWKAYKDARYEEAERLYRAAIKEAETASTQDITYSNSLYGLARVRSARGAPDEAEPLMLKSLALSEQLEPGSRNLAINLTGAGDQYRRTAKFAQALAMYQRAKAVVDQRSDSADLLINVWSGMGEVYMAQGRLTDAEPMLAQAVRVWSFSAAAKTTWATSIERPAAMRRRRRRTDGPSRFASVC